MTAKKLICPQPGTWNGIYRQLKEYAALNICEPKNPPQPMVLGHWFYSSDTQKEARWQETVSWAERNDCARLIDELDQRSFYSIPLSEP